ncbi:Maintenance of mitochondrial morphology protein 1 [Candida viswanathii]|uniref:Maintenance of mitochondrial morphology protein 1 n=1 Tax=Candida viswanathii TaxID=5486 RepID=A0A367Y2Y2_9ASCO|nr:Maintenance of mitochondrial morphology protein 1 [Candida viswanathii]
MTKELIKTETVPDDDFIQPANEQLSILEQLKIQQEELLEKQRELFLQDQLAQQQIQLQQQQLQLQQQSQSQPSNSWTFTQGLVLGQISVIFIIIVFVKFFVFADSSTIPTKKSSIDASGIIVKRNRVTKKDGTSDEIIEDEKLLDTRHKISTILEKTYYDVNNHSPESLDWFNVLVAQTISQLRTEALLGDNIYHSLNDFLETTSIPEFIDKINLTEIDIGDDFPIFSNCRIKYGEDLGRLEAKIDVDLSDTLTLGISTKLLLNQPRPLTAVLPVSLAVSIVRFSGCLTVSLINTKDIDLKNIEKEGQESDAEDDGGTALMFSFSPDYRLEFVVKSLIGSRAKLQDVPKISSLIESKLRTWFIERCVEPRFQVVRLPSLWPRTKNTREPINKKTSVSRSDSGTLENL